MKPSKKKVALAPAFVVSVSLLAAPFACGGETEREPSQNPPPIASGKGGASGSGSGGGQGGSKPNGCPASKPVAGTVCEGSAFCGSYSTGASCPSIMQCDKGTWREQQTGCNPPPPPCPATTPVEGATCPTGGEGNTLCPWVVDGCDVTLECIGTWKKRSDSCAVCPSETPTADAPCLDEGLDCKYFAGSLRFTCNALRWSASPGSGGSGGSGGGVAGAGGSSSGGVGGAGGSEPAIEPCPMSVPAEGSPCSEAGFGDRTCISIAVDCEVKSRCDEGAWKRIEDTCGS